MFPQVTWKGHLLQLMIKTQIGDTFGYLNMQWIQLWSFPEPALTLGEWDRPEQHEQKHQAASNISTKICCLQGTGEQVAGHGQSYMASGWSPGPNRTYLFTASKQLWKSPKPCQKWELKVSSLFSFSYVTGPSNKNMRKTIKNPKKISGWYQQN